MLVKISVYHKMTTLIDRVRKALMLQSMPFVSSSLTFRSVFFTMLGRAVSEGDIKSKLHIFGLLCCKTKPINFLSFWRELANGLVSEWNLRFAHYL